MKRIEAAKAKERMRDGGKGMQKFADLENTTTHDVVAEKH